MGQKVTRRRGCPDADAINAILDGERKNLTDDEAFALYEQFDKVVRTILQLFSQHQPTDAKTPRRRVSEVLKYKRIGYCHGHVVAFRTPDDTTPWLLFEHNNSLFASSYKAIKGAHASHRRNRVGEAELFLGENNLCIKAAQTEESSSHSVFHWAVEAWSIEPL
jgi:hypothetical protein